MQTDAAGIDPEQLATCLRVLDQMQEVPEDHPDYVLVRRATAKMFKAVKKQRRLEIRAAIAEADKAVVAATATGSPNRIDDETQGIALVSNAAGALAGTLITARSCYICKQKYQLVDAFYHQLCPDCAALNHA
ncbi:MAG: short-chain dehydrogenase, partial [Frankiales bacterium]|nr:short-chain dehydrogenase [Frankiales bacterium]